MRAICHIADFKRANCRAANFSHAHCVGISFWLANCQGAFLVQTNCQGGTFSEADMRGVNLTDAKLQGAYATDYKTMLTDRIGKYTEIYTAIFSGNFEQKDIEEIEYEKNFLRHLRLQKIIEENKTKPICRVMPKFQRVKIGILENNETIQEIVKNY